MKWVVNEHQAAPKNGLLLSSALVREVRAYHERLPQYSRPPLVALPCLARTLGIGQIFVKDESSRFGLNAFKVLGASYAIGRYLAGRLGLDLSAAPLEALRQENTRAALGDLVFAAATDGNHGVGVAWTARLLGYRAVIFMPKGTTSQRLENIRRLGAEVSITDKNYDDTVRFVAQKAAENGWAVIQDTAWKGYEDVPRWIMQGYATTASEAMEDLHGEPPTHVFLQAGVGAFASVMAEAFTLAYPGREPYIAVVEPENADCYYRSFRAGKKLAVTGDLTTIMAGLACGEPNPLGWEILKDTADASVSVPDWVAAAGMRVLACPLGSDPRIVSGESGAVPLGLLAVAAKDPDLRAALRLDINSRVLVFSTEGDTDPAVYRSVVWGGAYPAPEGCF